MGLFQPPCHGQLTCKALERGHALDRHGLIERGGDRDKFADLFLDQLGLDLPLRGDYLCRDGDTRLGKFLPLCL